MINLQETSGNISNALLFERINRLFNFSEQFVEKIL